jgi:hypothetical protein
MTRFFALAMVSLSLLGACAMQDHEALDVRKREFSQIKTIAIATVAARPSVSQTLFAGNRGELVNVLGKFETELSNAFVNRGFNVVNISQSGLLYSDPALTYETAYLNRTEDFMARKGSAAAVETEARRLRAASARLTGKIDDRGTFLQPLDNIDQITSPNTRIFPELGLNYRFNLPRTTENGGALDNRFLSDAARRSIGEITRAMGADAYLLIDANLLLSARKEGYVFTGATGGTRYVTMDAVASLVRNDGVILSVDWLRNQSIIPFGGINPAGFTSERVAGISGFHNSANQYNLLEGAYQAIRFSALELAKLYTMNRVEGIKEMKDK